MKPHTKLYLDHFGYSVGDFIPCEVCGKQAKDCHHLKARGMGGTKKNDTIENLMMVCRECHIKYGDEKRYVEFLRQKHNEALRTGRIL